jgi:hypothetical protein
MCRTHAVALDARHQRAQVAGHHVRRRLHALRPEAAKAITTDAHLAPRRASVGFMCEQDAGGACVMPG